MGALSVIIREKMEMDEDEKKIGKEIAQRLVNALNEILKEKGSRLNSDTLFHAVEGLMISCYGSARS